MIDDGANVSLGTQLDDIRKFIGEQPETTKIGVAYMQNGGRSVLHRIHWAASGVCSVSG
jgi:hypothetical protein